MTTGTVLGAVTAAPLDAFLLETSAELLELKLGPRLYDRLLERAAALCGSSLGLLLARQEDGLYRVVAELGFCDADLSQVALSEEALQAAAPFDAFKPLSALESWTSLRGLWQAEASLVIPLSYGYAPQALLLLEAEPEVATLTSIQVFSKRVATVLQHAALRSEAERQARESALLDRLRSRLTTELCLTTLLKIATEQTSCIFGYSRLSIYLLDNDGLRLACEHGYRGRAAAWLDPAKGVVSRVLKSGDPILVRDVRQDADYLSPDGKGVSIIVAPIYRGGTLLGTFEVESTQKPLTASDLRLVVAVAKELSAASERSRLHEAALQNQSRFKLLAENMRDVVSLHDPDGTASYVSPSAVELTGYAPQRLLGRRLLSLIHPHHRVAFDLSPEQFASRDLAPFTFRLRSASGAYRWVETTLQPILGENGELLQLVASTRDITRRRHVEERLEHLAQHDPMTGLANRTLFMQRLEETLDHKTTDPKHLAVLLFVDLDRFKLVNDSFGHSVGDALLAELSRRLLESVRPGDTVARLGGDEFAVILDNLSKNSEAKQITERILAGLKRPFEVQGREVFSSASIGLAFVTSASLSPSDLLRNADVAMYEAKKAGGSDYAVFNEALYDDYKRRLSLEGDLRAGLEQGQFFLTYQPLFNLAERKVAGFEALLRWRHPKHGVIAPDTFVPLAEESDLILDVDRWVIKEACRQMDLWNARFPVASDLFMSINLSTRHLGVENAAGRLAGMVRVMGINPGQIKLEVTEGSLLINAEASARVLAGLRSAGIKIQLDDFGTGYSSLSYLHKLPLDSLKIDRSFVQRMGGGRQDEEIVKTILALGSALGLDVVAEGVETAYQLKRLSELGCQYGQGYLIAKALEAPEVEARYLTVRDL